MLNEKHESLRLEYLTRQEETQILQFLEQIVGIQTISAYHCIITSIDESERVIYSLVGD